MLPADELREIEDEIEQCGGELLHSDMGRPDF